MFLDNRSKIPIYQQLKNNYIEQIAKGILKPDEKLMSVRILAKELGVNPNTVQRAYTELEQAGIIYQIMGKGSFVSPNSELWNYIHKEKFEELDKIFNESKEMGIDKEKIKNLLDKVYEEGENT